MTADETRCNHERHCRPAFGLLGLAALVGLAAAAVLIFRRRTEGSRLWSVDDLIGAADRAAESLERNLMGERVHAN